VGLDGRETYDIGGLAAGMAPRQRIMVRATDEDGRVTEFPVIVRIDTPVEMDYYQHGGILSFVLRQLMKN